MQIPSEMFTKIYVEILVNTMMLEFFFNENNSKNRFCGGPRRADAIVIFFTAAIFQYKIPTFYAEANTFFDAEIERYFLGRWCKKIF